MSDKIDFKTKAITRDNEGHYIMLKGSLQQEATTLVNMYVPNIEAPKYIKQILMDIKGEISSKAITVGDFSTPLTSMDRFSRGKPTRKQWP